MPGHAGRRFLQIPNPTILPDRILRAIDRPTIDHRGPAFGALGREAPAGMLAGIEMGPHHKGGVLTTLDHLAEPGAAAGPEPVQRQGRAA